MKTRSPALGQVRGFRGEMPTPTEDRDALVITYARTKLAEDLARAGTRQASQPLTPAERRLGEYAAALARLEWSQAGEPKSGPALLREHLDFAATRILPEPK